jgi:carbonic anhydrase/acetyltransferase-like protein (isoleucine patch superfamily)
MGSIVMDNAVIGSGSIVGAGAVVLAGVEIPAGSLVLGSPGRRVRDLTPEHHNWILHSWKVYAQLAAEHSSGEAGT